MDMPKLKSVPNDATSDRAAPDDDFLEPTKEELLADLRIALRDAIAGKDEVPARAGLEAIRRRIYDDADQG